MIFTQALPLGKSFFATLTMPAWDVLFLTRFIAACLAPRAGRFSAASVALCLRLDAVHRGNIGRKLRRLPKEALDAWMADVLYSLLSGDCRGTYLFVVDATYCSHHGCPENLTRTGQHGKIENHPLKDKRQKHKQRPPSGSHCFVMGLLLTPDGLRWPCFKSYYTKEYCQPRGWKHLSQAELAAVLIEQLPVPGGAKVIVIGDAAFDAAVVIAACRKRQFDWLVTMNTERRLAGATAQDRPLVMSMVPCCTAEQFVPVRLTPGEGPYEAYRRSAVCRVGLKRQSRTFWVREVDREVHNVGWVRLLFSTKQEVKAGQAVKVQKVLMTSLKTLKVEDIIEIYDLRCKVELMFRELKSVLGMADYKFNDFDSVEGWVGMCLMSLVYLEWYRQQMLRQANGDPNERQRWHRQRCHGLRLAVLQDLEAEELLALYQRLQSPQQVDALKRLLRLALPVEYRKAS